MKSITYILAVVIALLVSGCSVPKVKTKWVDKSAQKYSQSQNNPIGFRYQPVIGTKQADTKVMIDMGEWAKIWVKNYRNENKTFVATHSIVTMIREPGFISGEQIPRRRRESVYNTYGSRSFTFRSQDLTYDNSSYGSENTSDEQIKDYMNSYEYSKKTRRMDPQKREASIIHDKAIIEYIRKSKQDKKDKFDAIKKSQEIEDERIRLSKNEKSDAVYADEDEYKNGGLK